MIAISPDSMAESESLAAALGIDFPLLHDKDNQWAKKYAGLTEDGFPIPALFLLRPDGSVFYSKTATAKNDRVYAGRLMQLVDDMNKTSASESLPAVAEFEKSNTIRVGAGLGVEHGDDTNFALDLELTYMRRLGRYFGLGLQATTLALPDRELAALVVPRLQLPYLSGVGEVYLELPLGFARRFVGEGENGLHAGVALGSEFEIKPTMIAFANLDMGGTRFDAEAGSSTVISRFVLQFGAGWKF